MSRPDDVGPCITNGGALTCAGLGLMIKGLGERCGNVLISLDSGLECTPMTGHNVRRTLERRVRELDAIATVLRADLALMRDTYPQSREFTRRLHDTITECVRRETARLGGITERIDAMAQGAPHPSTASDDARRSWLQWIWSWFHAKEEEG